MRVLVATPTYGDGPRVETGRSIEAQTLRGNLEWLVVRENPYPAPDVRNVVAAYQKIREIFLAGSWDALLTVEHDMVLPGFALERLWELQKPVAYGVYMLRHGAKVLNAWEYVGDRNVGESLTLALYNHRGHRLLGRNAPGFMGQPVRVSGVGFGCTLMRREVVERFPFHDGAATGSTAPDLPFAQDCLRAGVEQWAHFGVLCGHWEDGRVLWPFEEDMQPIRKVIAQQNVTVSVNRQSVAMTAGQEYEIPEILAGELARAGYVRVVDGVSHGTAGDRDADVQAAPSAATKHRKSAAAKR